MEEEQKVPVQQIDPGVRRKRKIIALGVSCGVIVVTIALAVGLRVGLHAAIDSAYDSSSGSSSSSSGSSSGTSETPVCVSPTNFTLYNGPGCQGPALGAAQLNECMVVELVNFSIRRSDNGASWLSFDQSTYVDCTQTAPTSNESGTTVLATENGGNAPQTGCMPFKSINNKTNTITFACQHPN